MKLQMTVCPHVRHRPHAQRKFGLEFVTLAKSNDRFCEIMQRRRGRLTNLVGVRSEELLRVHRSDLSATETLATSAANGRFSALQPLVLCAANDSSELWFQRVAATHASNFSAGV